MAESRRESIDHNHVIEVLERLIEVNRDGQDGFRDAAEHVKNPELRAFLNEVSTVRADFAGELENEAIRLGKHDPRRRGSPGGVLHRGWLDLKASLGGGDHSILSSVESGEDSAKKIYEEVLNERLPQDLRDIIRQQSQSVFAAHDRVKTFRDRLKAA